MTCPASSQINPEPVPRGTVKTLRVQKSLTRDLVVIKTTQSRDFSNSSMVAFSSAARSPRAATVLGVASGLGENQLRMFGIDCQSAHIRMHKSTIQISRTTIRPCEVMSFLSLLPVLTGNRSGHNISDHFAETRGIVHPAAF